MYLNNVLRDSNIISSRWIFKYKRDANRQITKRKARLVVEDLHNKWK